MILEVITLKMYLDKDLVLIKLVKELLLQMAYIMSNWDRLRVLLVENYRQNTHLYLETHKYLISLIERINRPLHPQILKVCGVG